MSKRLRPWALVGVPALVLLGALIVWLQGGRYASTENAFVKADITQVAGEVPGRIIEVRVRDHAVVAAGDVLFRLDPAPYQLALAKAEAEIDSARAAVEQLKVSLREIRAEATEAENKLSYLQTQAKRHRDLSGRGVTSTARVEQANSEEQEGQDRLAVLHQRIARVEAALGGKPDQPTDQYRRRPRKAGDARSRGAGSRLHRDQGARAPASSSISGCSSASRSRRRRRCSRSSPTAGPGSKPTSRKPT